MQNFLQAISGIVTSSFPIINPILVLLAGLLGSRLFGKISSLSKSILLRALGLLVILMGAVEIWNGFFVLQTAQFETPGTLLVIVSLIVGFVFGYALSLDRSIGQAGVWLFRRFIKDKLSRAEIIARAKGEEPAKPRKVREPSAEGFMLATVLCAFSSTTVYSVLCCDSAEDPLPFLLRLGFHAAVFFLLAALYGVNVPFAAISVLAVEVVLLAAGALFADFITSTLLNQLRLIGAVMLVFAGVSLGSGKRVRAPHLIPAYVIPVIYGLAVILATKLMGAA